MLRKIIIFSVCAMASASLPTLYETNKDAFLDPAKPTVTTTGEPTDGIELASSKPAGQETLSGRKVRLAADARGHYFGDFKMNGRKIAGMVDTGATYVAINVSTARKIGLHLAADDFKYPVDTANGKAMAAAVTIETLQIGRIVIEDVQTVVLEDKALSGTLIGASFLNRLEKFQVENGSLLLAQ